MRPGRRAKQARRASPHAAKAPGPALPYGFAGRNAKNSRPSAALRVRRPERQGSRPRAALRVRRPELQELPAQSCPTGSQAGTPRLPAQSCPTGSQAGTPQVERAACGDKRALQPH
ncbi:hypothetical protein [Paenibacillus sp. P3E]|uniref:hypothetical protein n=1 Tax=Paenibacillus sp. P3E TaxID=1349435 RepID=UPI001160F42E|nr:hypothetical protein [Paenibacillus sp. P3E]